jgi:hypothetical protein
MVQADVGRAILWSMLSAATIALLPGLARAQQSGPVIDSVSMREDDSGPHMVIHPEFHFHDSTGSTIHIHREVVASNEPQPRNAKDGVINISPQRQMQGAVFVGGWHCGPESYFVTLRAFMMNAAGGKSNVVEYTIHCNGG